MGGKKKRQERKNEEKGGKRRTYRWRKDKIKGRRTGGGLEWKRSQVDTYEFSGLRRQHVRVLY